MTIGAKDESPAGSQGKKGVRWTNRRGRRMSGGLVDNNDSVWLRIRDVRTLLDVAKKKQRKEGMSNRNDGETFFE